MNVSSVKFRSIEKINTVNKVKAKTIENKSTDRVEISDLGKYLNKVNASNQEVKLDKVNTSKEEMNIDKINSIKQRIENGTYKVDSKDLANKIIEHMRGEL